MFSSSVGSDCTHLITTQKEVERNGTKCELALPKPWPYVICLHNLITPDQQACGLKKCEVVSIDWLLDSGKAKKPVSEKPYRFGASNNNQTDGVPVKTEMEKKRSAKAVDNTDADADDSNKKPKIAAGDAQTITADKANKIKVGVDELYWPNETVWRGNLRYLCPYAYDEC